MQSATQTAGVNVDEDEDPPPPSEGLYVGRGATARVLFHADRTTWLVARLLTPADVHATCDQGATADFVVLYATVRDSSNNVVATLRLADNEGEPPGGVWDRSIQVPVCAGDWTVDFHAESALCGTWPVTPAKTQPFQLGDWCLNEK